MRNRWRKLNSFKQKHRQEVEKTDTVMYNAGGWHMWYQFQYISTYDGRRYKERDEDIRVNVFLSQKKIKLAVVYCTFVLSHSLCSFQSIIVMWIDFEKKCFLDFSIELSMKFFSSQKLTTSKENNLISSLTFLHSIASPMKQCKQKNHRRKCDCFGKLKNLGKMKENIFLCSYNCNSFKVKQTETWCNDNTNRIKEKWYFLSFSQEKSQISRRGKTITRLESFNITI